MDYLQYNNSKRHFKSMLSIAVLNLVINGLPSIRKEHVLTVSIFNPDVLNLVINGLPSRPQIARYIGETYGLVLNLVINGLPSILYKTFISN